MFKQYLYKLYLLTLALPLVAALIIIGWKKEILSANARVCGLTPGWGFRTRFYHAAALDLLRFLHGHYGSPITSRPQDGAKIDRLRLGPSLLLTAHFHNWELMGGWLVRQGIPLLSAARPMVQGISQTLLVRLRDRLGQKVLFHDVPRRALRHIQGGGCFGLLWDQRVPASKIRAPLFGRTLAMDPLPRFLARNADLPVFVGVLLPGGGFRILQIASPRSTASAPHPSSSGVSRPHLSSSRPEAPVSEFVGLRNTPQSIPLVSAASDSDSGSARGWDAALDSAVGSNPTSLVAPLSGPTHPQDSNLPSTLPDPSLSPDPVPPIGSKRASRHDSGQEPEMVDGGVEFNRLGRRYHRILECLVRAHPTSWYGLTHRRFLS